MMLGGPDDAGVVVFGGTAGAGVALVLGGADATGATAGECAAGVSAEMGEIIRRDKKVIMRSWVVALEDSIIRGLGFFVFLLGYNERERERE